MIMDEIILKTDPEITFLKASGSDASICAAARVSAGGDFLLDTAITDSKKNKSLLRYLVKFRHGSPFEHTMLQFKVHAPIFVFREWHRHRAGMSYNEVSGRYSVLEPVFWIPGRERKMLPAHDHKPISPKYTRMENDVAYAEAISAMTHSYKTSWKCYESLIASGVANEVARGVLPVSVYSTMIVTMNVRSLMHFLSLRVSHPDAFFETKPQYEIQQCGEKMEEYFKLLFPMTYEAYVEARRVSP